MNEPSRTWHSLTAAEACTALASDSARGLAAAEAKRRLEENGPNELVEKPRPGFLALLLDQFKDFLILILIAAAVISIVLGEYVDAGAIILIVILNAIVGVVQESKAEEALAALKRMAAPEARAVRDGATLMVPARELVPGDVVLLEAGNYVPADVRLLEAVNLRIEEASLTGESVPVEKEAGASVGPEVPLGDRLSMAYLGTMVTFGRGRGLVVETGMRTQIGLIAAMIQEEEHEDTPLQKKLAQMGRWLGIGALAICAVVFLVGVLEGRNILVMFMTSVSLAIAAVPEGLPAIVTICLALGMQEMIKRHALIRKLPAVETLGSATVICTDKTGTLTQNEMTAGRIWADRELLEVTGEGYQPEGEVRKDSRRAELRDSSVRLLLQAAMLASDAHLELVENGPEGKRWHMVGDPTEGALVVAAAKADLHRQTVEAHYPRVAEMPFDSVRKLMSTVHAVPAPPAVTKKEAVLFGMPTPYVLFVKGAPDELLVRCTRILVRGVVMPLEAADRSSVLEANSHLASGALRVLGVAFRGLDAVPESPDPATVERDLVFIGLVGMMDPARPEAPPAVETAHRAGLRVIMVTGDYKETAAAIGRSIGLMESGDVVLSGAEIDAHDDVQLATVLDRVSVFARVSPQHKVRVVDALKKKGHVVGMTGDGVNDAPALKRADIGIAMGITGTDVTKETADMVLTDDNFASIISAVEQGRIIFSNIRKFVFFLLSCNLAEIAVVFIGTLVGWPVPLTAIQLLWINLLTDGAPALALGLEKGEPDLMLQPPRPVKEPIITGPMMGRILLQSSAITFAALFAFWYGLNVKGSGEWAGTMAFVTLMCCELIRAYTNRSERASIFSIGVFSNKYMQYAVFSSVALLLAALYVPFLSDRVFGSQQMGWREWAVALPLALLPAFVDEMCKVVLRLRDRRARAVQG
ncbi:MAG: cation-translocating P-type ATPase [Spirochaetes bacterium]|nr:cation-translocating P-type ATPase [Spirochaetota bacterium]